MNSILGIKFRDYGQVCFFTEPARADAPQPANLTREENAAPAACSIRIGDTVIAETGQGLGLGTVVHVGAVVPSGMAEQDVKPILRATTDKDQGAIVENRRLTAEAMRYCAARIRGRELDMKLVDVEVLFDKSKFVFYFTAPTRIDFRELVKDLVREYHARIELRQIGVRHETQMIGAVGNCGMVCCCRRFLRKFAPVTIKMAKEQNLFLNPAKISGICGRLLCCLSYEQENYDAFHRECPRLGKRYQTRIGDLKILRANMFRHSLVALNANGEEVELTLDEWRAMDPRRPDAVSVQAGRAPEEKSVRRDDEFMIVTADPGTPESPDARDFAAGFPDEDAGADPLFANTLESWDEDNLQGQEQRLEPQLLRNRRKHRGQSPQSK